MYTLGFNFGYMIPHQVWQMLNHIMFFDCFIDRCYCQSDYGRSYSHIYIGRCYSHCYVGRCYSPLNDVILYIKHMADVIAN